MIFSCFRINHSFNSCLKDKLLPLVLGTFLLTALSLGHAGTPQTLTFPPIADRVTTDAAFPLSATASSGLPVTYDIVSAAGVASVGGGTITLSGTAGSVTVKASQAGDSTYDPASDVYRSFAVGTASQKFAKLAVNAHGIHELVIKPNGTLWGWGGNNFGQLGDGAGWLFVPTQIGTATTWASVSCGYYHTAALRTDGSLYTAGYSYYGQLGRSGANNILTKVGTSTWTAVSCGENHTVALRSDGTLWACGDNTYGQLGINSTTQSGSLVQIGSVNTWTAVACGFSHTLALRADGTLWAWGRNSLGQLGDGSFTQRNSPVKIGTSTTWTVISGGAYHSLALRGDGSLWGWGNNGDGQLASDNATLTLSNVPVQAPGPAIWASVSAGDFHSVGRRQDGTLWGWGNNYTGQLGTAAALSSFTPLQVGSSAGTGTAILGRSKSSTVLQASGTLQGLGKHLGLDWGEYRPADQIGGKDVPTTWGQVAGARLSQVAIAKDGTLWTGGVDGPPLGNGTNSSTDRLIKISEATNWTQASANEFHAASVRADGTLWTWGFNGDGRLGDGTTTTRNAPVQVPGTIWAQVACGAYHTAARRSDGTLWAWGENADGQVGDNSSTDRLSPVQVGTGTDWADVSCGANFTVAVRTDGTLWAWGGNYSGQLGDGTSTTRLTPVKIGTAGNWRRIACGAVHTLALRTDGTLWAWGSNSYGQLGDGTITNRNAPVHIGTNANWTAIAGGRWHSAATRQDGTLWSWGDNEYGQLGDGTRTARSAPVQCGTATNWNEVSCRVYGTLALRSDGTLWNIGSTEGHTTVRVDLFVPNTVWPPRSTQTLTFPALAAPLTPGQPVTLAATATSGLPVTYTIVGPATLSGGVLTPTGAGTITIAAYQNGTPAWHTADSLMQTVTVQAALSAQQSWRQTHFGTTANSGTAADTADFDHDGLPNLLEFAFGLTPTAGTSASSQLPQPVHNPATQTFTYSFTEPAEVAGTGLIYRATASTSLQAGSGTPVPDTGSGTTHIFSVPTTGQLRMFIQLQVTAP